MKILMILGTGAILTFPMDPSIEPDCFSQGHAILQKLAVYQDSGPEQGWYLKDSTMGVGGWYCQ